VILSDGRSPTEIFRAAKNSQTQVRHMKEEEMTLQEVFASAIEAINHSGRGPNHNHGPNHNPGEN